MDKVIDFKRKKAEKDIKKAEKKFTDNGVEPKRVMICMNSYQLVTLIRKILEEKKPTEEILRDNENLYIMGYLHEDGTIQTVETPCV